ncbi:transposase [Massilia sp. CCM 8733]|uniref:Transposase n=1 Tax=Massilia mucilaginosa TaxID=2609282 RepID=A0ABX0NNC9_9BURK|nr:transposase [Massilia mucilaginosa]
MTRSKTYTPELREEAVKLVLTQGLTLEDASLRLTIPKGTLANWVAAARHGTSPKVAPGSRSVPEWVFRTNVTSDSGIVTSHSV